MTGPPEIPLRQSLVCETGRSFGLAGIEVRLRHGHVGAARWGAFAIAWLQASVWVPDLASQCLDVKVIDPASVPVPTALASTGGKEVPTDSSGVASLCGLGDGPHSLLITAHWFQRRGTDSRGAVRSRYGQA